MKEVKWFTQAYTPQFSVILETWPRVTHLCSITLSNNTGSREVFDKKSQGVL
jgi:hypothetical protein